MTLKEKYKFKKQQRKHRKALIKLAKEDEDFDWGYLHELVITKVRHMYEYYTAGDNVWQTDDTRFTIVATLKYVLNLQDELDNLFKTPVDGIEYDHSVHGVTKVTYINEAKCDLEYKYQREQELYKEIYSYIGAHLQLWWD